MKAERELLIDAENPCTHYLNWILKHALSQHWSFFFAVAVKIMKRVVELHRDCLMELFISTNGPSWKRNGKWGTTAKLKHWEGVKVNDEGEVQALELKGNGLVGRSQRLFFCGQTCLVSGSIPSHVVTIIWHLQMIVFYQARYPPV